MDVSPKTLLSDPDRPGERVVLDDELEDIWLRRRRAVDPTAPGPPAAVPSEAELDEVRHSLCGIALSGGGIRSATFSLGVLQALHQRGVLPVFDYLSTVSGGGFTGGWWTAWLCREPRRELFPSGEKIEPQRAPNYVAATAQTQGTRLRESSLSAASDPVHHLRLFSNYLTPRKGLFSSDFWRAIAVVSRNLLTTWLVLVPILFAVVLAGQVALFALQGSAATGTDVEEIYRRHPFFVGRPVPVPPVKPLERGAAVASEQARTEYATQYAEHAKLKAIHDDLEQKHEAAFQQRLGLAGAVIGVVWLMGFLMGTAWFLTLESEHGVGWLAFSAVALAAFVVFAISLVSVARGHAAWPTFSTAVSFVFSSQFLIVLLIALVPTWSVWRALKPGSAEPLEVRRNHLVGEHGRWLIAFVLVTLTITISWFGHDIVTYLGDQGRTSLTHYVARTGGWLAALAAILGAVFTAFKAAPSGGKEPGKKESPWAMSRLIFAATPPLFLFVLAVACAWAARHVLMKVSPSHPSALFGAIVAGVVMAVAIIGVEYQDHQRTGARFHMARARQLSMGVAALVVPLMALYFFAPPSWIVLTMAVALLGAVLAWVVTLGWMIDPNALSLHLLYRARLVRAYLGASNETRKTRQAEITDAVPGDDLTLSALDTCGRGGPYLLVNTTLNLAGGRDLVTAQRSAASFTFSRKYCGSGRTGYRPTTEYMGDQLTLGTAVAVSGAAASPNMGSITPTASQAMLLTLFNVRLGYWLPTPNKEVWRSAQARLWPYYVLREFLSQTNDIATYCYLTDGGHFDNTGLYALVERGCRFIVIVDDGADPEPCFEDMGNAIRRCRIDFGAEVCFDVDGFRRPKDAEYASRHFAIGTIRYSAAHARALRWRWDEGAEPPTGVVVWLKPTLKGDEPADVRQYALENSQFPQHPTADQWFGESQFESYRKLGQFTAEQVFSSLDGVELGELRRCLITVAADAECAAQFASGALQYESAQANGARTTEART
jgi:predicted acylesterase/phospholipase RssA